MFRRESTIFLYFLYVSDRVHSDQSKFRGVRGWLRLEILRENGRAGFLVAFQDDRKREVLNICRVNHNFTLLYAVGFRCLLAVIL